MRFICIFAVCNNYKLENMQNETQFLQKVKQSVKSQYPDAQVILFGSQARKQANSDSDWDFLILLNNYKISPEIEKSIRHPLYRLEWETGQIISTLIKPKAQWESETYKNTDLYKNILEEGKML